MKNLVIAIAVGLILYWLTSSKKPDKEETDEHDKVLSDAYTVAVNEYGADIARNIEKIHRKETNDFTKQFTWDTMSLGMNSFANKFPYGWTSMVKFWEKNPQYAPTGITTDHDHWNREQPLIVFPTMEAGIMTTGYFLMINKNDAGKWHAKDKAMQLAYSADLKNIQTGYVP